MSSHKKIDIKDINGGLQGIASIISTSIMCSNYDLIKNQILENDDILITGLENFAVHDLGKVVRYIAHGVLDIPISSSYLDDTLGGDVQMFSTETDKVPSTNLGKCKLFVKNSHLEIEDKSLLLDNLIKAKFEYSATDIFYNIFKEDYPIFYRLFPFMEDFTIEKEYRLNELKKVLDKLDEAIDNNNELMQLNCPKHLLSCAKMANSSYLEFLNSIEKDLSPYVSSISVKSSFRNDSDSTEKVVSEPNPHPEIFKDGIIYLRFIKYQENHIVEPYIDYSYIFQKMKAENMIHYTLHKTFMVWLRENDFINEKKYNEFLDKISFSSLGKCEKPERLNNFYNIFDT